MTGTQACSRLLGNHYANLMNVDLSTGRAAFEEAFSALGSRATGTEWETLLSSPRSSIALLRKQYQVLRNCHVDFIGDDSVNGAATFRNGWALIACNTGTAEVFTALFAFLLSQPDCLAGIGDETRERRWIKSLAKCEWSRGRKAVEGQLSVCRAVPNCLPVDATRRWWVSFLSYIALEFVYYHELGHLVLDHLPMDGRVTLEFSETTVNQFFELEADAWATRALFARLIGLVGTEENVPTHQVAIAALTIAAFFVYLARLYRVSGVYSQHLGPSESRKPTSDAAFIAALVRLSTILIQSQKYDLIEKATLPAVPPGMKCHI